MNRDFKIRRRYAKLYQDYRSEYHWWRLILLMRKLLLVIITVMAKCRPARVCA